MFTGLVGDIGRIIDIYQNQEGKVFSITAPKIMQQLVIGDSIAVNGTCLTIIYFDDNFFSVQAVHVTLQKTTLGTLQRGSLVNVELALRSSDRLGGHFVQGHINDTAIIKKIDSCGNNYVITIVLTPLIEPYIVKEGSIAIDGISLTIAEIATAEFAVSIIPHTWQVTTLSTKKIGDLVNIEVDILAKYVERFIQKQHTNKTITRDWLQMHGY